MRKVTKQIIQLNIFYNFFILVTSNPCEADAGNPCVSDGVSHTCRLQAGGQFKCSCKDGFINDKAGKYCIGKNQIRNEDIMERHNSTETQRKNLLMFKCR